MKTVKIFLVNIILCSYSVAEYSNYLENSKFFSPLECGVISNCEHFYTRDYFEFSKIYNAKSRKEAISDFYKLKRNAKTSEAVAWANLGLLKLGEINREILEKEIEVGYFDGTISAKRKFNFLLKFLESFGLSKICLCC